MSLFRFLPFLLVLNLLAQDDTTGKIRGSVLDPAGSPLAHAQIQLHNPQKGLTWQTLANSDGTYQFKNLPIGLYSLTVSLDGFETVKSQEISVQVGSTTVFDAVLLSQTAQYSETLLVTGGEFKGIDVKNTTSGLVLKTEEIQKLPVKDNLNAVAHLAPGTTRGDSDFGSGDLVSFGGSSVAENGYYLNGINLTDTRKGIGSVSFPWEAVQQVQVKTGGTTAEFGRHIGGVINMVTKSGTNDFAFSLKTVWDPKSLQAQNPTTFWPDSEGNETLMVNHSEDQYDRKEYNFSASGPIVKDHAFFYLLFAPKRTESQYADTGSYGDSSYKTDTWLAKIDWYITPLHSLALMAINNEGDTVAGGYLYNYTQGPGDFLGNTYYFTGGDIWSLKYLGHINENLSISATYGNTVYNNNRNADKPERSAYWDSRSGTWVRLGEWVSSSLNTKKDDRVNYRMDLNLALANHQFKLGVDREQLDVEDLTIPTGDGYYEYYRAPINNIYGLSEGTDYVDKRVFVRGGNSETRSDSWYIQDEWAASPYLTLNLGLRNTTFKNTTSDGRAYVNIKNQYAPRIGLSWDPRKQGKDQIYANFGRFYMPVSANTNVRMASGELDEHFIYYLEGVNADGSPILGELIQHDIVSDGQVADADRLFNLEAGPMYSDEYILGYHHEFNNNFVFGVRGVYRDLVQSIEDVSFSYGMNAWIDEHYPGAAHVGGWFAVLTNPGRDITIPYDVDGDGTKEMVTVPKDQLGFPDSSRKYLGLELTLNGHLGDKFRFDSSYTWSHNYGNTEGLLRSDNDQTDPGWTTSFDYPELMDYSYGNLPNDHRHKLKLNGLYEWAKNLSSGVNFYLETGRPVNSFGVHPEDDCPGDCYGRIWYGASSFFTNGEPVPRGSAGTTPTISNWDLNLNYILALGHTQIFVKLELFNAFNQQSATQVEEYAEFDSGAPRPYYGQPTHWQSPRQVRLTLRFDF